MANFKCDLIPSPCLPPSFTPSFSFLALHSFPSHTLPPSLLSIPFLFFPYFHFHLCVSKTRPRLAGRVNWLDKSYYLHCKARRAKKTNKQSHNYKRFVRQAQTSQFEKSMFLAHLLTRQHLTRTLNMHCVFLMSPYCLCQIVKMLKIMKVIKMLIKDLCSLMLPNHNRTHRKTISITNPSHLAHEPTAGCGKLTFHETSSLHCRLNHFENKILTAIMTTLVSFITGTPPKASFTLRLLLLKITTLPHLSSPHPVHHLHSHRATCSLSPLHCSEV